MPKIDMKKLNRVRDEGSSDFELQIHKLTNDLTTHLDKYEKCILDLLEINKKLTNYYEKTNKVTTPRIPRNERNCFKKLVSKINSFIKLCYPIRKFNI